MDCPLPRREIFLPELKEREKKAPRERAAGCLLLLLSASMGNKSGRSEEVVCAGEAQVRACAFFVARGEPWLLTLVRTLDPGLSRATEGELCPGRVVIGG